MSAVGESREGRRRRADAALLVGVVSSLLLHATVIWPWTVRVMTADVRPPVSMLTRFEPGHIQTPPQEPLFLGIDAPTPSTVTWIGYEEYRKHLAALGETEQAAFRTTPAGSEPVESAPAQAPPQERAPTTAEPPSQAPTTTPAAETPPDVAPPQPAVPESPVEPRPPAPQVPPGEPDDPAAVSDLESDPTSTVDVPWDKVTLGQPVAAQGLTLKPRKPVFTTWVRFTAAPANPAVSIRFGRDGVPVRAAIDLSSGDSRVDEAILNSLYRWRASGARLEELDEGGTIVVSLRIVLSSKRR